MKRRFSQSLFYFLREVTLCKFSIELHKITEFIRPLESIDSLNNNLIIISP